MTGEGEEFHLDVAEALAFRYGSAEAPADLEWKDHKFSKLGSSQRKSSSQIPDLVKSHLIFALSAAPFRFMFGAGFLLAMLSLVPLALAVHNLFTPTPSAFLALTGLSLSLLLFLCIAFGLLAVQNLAVQRDVWRVRSDMRRSAKPMPSSTFKSLKSTE